MAHPRVGGENEATVESWLGAEGSSPRGRGKPEAARIVPSVVRLIPAWAGKTTSARLASLSQPAHPRVGGENQTGSSTQSRQKGSSPRGRGKRSRVPRVGLSTRLIPAWAGKTLFLVGHPYGQPAHPRVGGENVGTLRGGAAAAGSSPRGRGKPFFVISQFNIIGLIPAWAGKTRDPGGD